MSESDAMHISERELRALTANLDQMHHDQGMPAMRDAVANLTDAVASVSATRRRFLFGAGAAVGGLVLAACSSGKSTSASAGGSVTTAAASGDLTGDLAIAALAASLENLAVKTYQAGLDAATAGKLGAVPPSVAEFAMTAQRHHKDHAAAWNSILKGAGKTAITGVDVTVDTGVVQPAFAQVKDVAGLGKLALELENVAAATYLSGLGAIKDNGALKIAASIQPIEMQHAAILHFVLGEYPVPDTFAKTEGARTGSDKIG